MSSRTDAVAHATANTMTGPTTAAAWPTRGNVEGRKEAVRAGRCVVTPLVVRPTPTRSGMLHEFFTAPSAFLHAGFTRPATVEANGQERFGLGSDS